jgi:hypothetical protein
MYSIYVRQLSSAYEEIAESITGEDNECIMQKYEGMSLQKILFGSNAGEVLDYILHTRKQRETLKKFGPNAKRAELKFLACLHLEGCLNMFQVLDSYCQAAVSGKELLEHAMLMHYKTIHPALSSPLNYLKKRYAESSAFLEKFDSSKNPPVN